MAFLGILAAFDILLMVLAAIIESNTLFLLAAAAFLVGIAIREFGIQLGTSFFVVCSLLGFFLAPNKLYVMTFAGFSLYIIWNELAFNFLSRAKFQNSRKILFFLVKIIFFNLLYIPAITLLPQLFFAGTMSTKVYILFIVLGQPAVLIYDKAYEYFQTFVWGSFRKRIKSVLDS
jgi:hypothetical protein